VGKIVRQKCDIALVGSFPPPYGGQSVHLEQLFSSLCQDGRQVIVLNTGRNKEIRHDHVINIRSSISLLKSILFKINPGIIHVHVSDMTDFSKLLPVYLGEWFLNYHWILTIHSGNIESNIARLKRYQTLLIRLMSRKISNVICVNQQIRGALAQWTDDRKLAVIPAFNFSFHETPLDPYLNDFLNSHNPVLSCTGFYEPVYGFDLAIQAIGHLKKVFPQIGLALIGDKRNCKTYEDMIHQQGLSSSIFMCGDINHDECLSIIKRSTLFVRPTRYDGDAISVREALALQIPVIASATEFRPYGVDTFKVGDLHDLISKISRSLEKKPDGVRAIDLHSENIEQIKEIYREVGHDG